jgi:hypothetical protein
MHKIDCSPAIKQVQHASTKSFINKKNTHVYICIHAIHHLGWSTHWSITWTIQPPNKPGDRAPTCSGDQATCTPHARATSHLSPVRLLDQAASRPARLRLRSIILQNDWAPPCALFSHFAKWLSSPTSYSNEDWLSTVATEEWLSCSSGKWLSAVAMKMHEHCSSGKWLSTIAQWEIVEHCSMKNYLIHYNG